MISLATMLMLVAQTPDYEQDRARLVAAATRLDSVYTSVFSDKMTPSVIIHLADTSAAVAGRVNQDPASAGRSIELVSLSLRLARNASDLSAALRSLSTSLDSVPKRQRFAWELPDSCEPGAPRPPGGGLPPLIPDAVEPITEEIRCAWSSVLSSLAVSLGQMLTEMQLVSDSLRYETAIVGGQLRLTSLYERFKDVEDDIAALQPVGASRLTRMGTILGYRDGSGAAGMFSLHERIPLWLRLSLAWPEEDGAAVSVGAGYEIRSRVIPSASLTRVGSAFGGEVQLAVRLPARIVAGIGWHSTLGPSAALGVAF